MGRTAKHNWQALFLEFNQGRYKNVADFARAKGLHPVAARREFAKLKNLADDPPETQQNITKKRNKTQQKNRAKTETKQKNHPWQKLKQQFTDWPDDKRQAYLIQLEARLAELNAADFEELSPGEQKELGQLRRERRAILSDPDPDKQCSAHNRDGQPCGNPAERGKEVCWVHGGAPGTGAPAGNKNGLRHGFYSRIMPDDPEIKAIVVEIDTKSPIDILWDQIVIQYTAIARAQRIMYVTEKEEMIKELKRSYEKNTTRRTEKTSTDSGECEYEYEFQFAWDRQASFLTAQSKAMATLEKLIARYETMATGEQKAKVAKLRADIERISGGDDGAPEDDGFIEALKTEAAEVWGDEED